MLQLNSSIHHILRIHVSYIDVYHFADVLFMVVVLLTLT